MMDSQRIADLANQIASNQTAYPQQVAVQRVGEHIVSFWEQRMCVILQQIWKLHPDMLHEYVIGAMPLVIAKRL